ncbi:MAG: glycosyltransferase family 2 protein [Alphaproteobacteria bacterium]|uniref:glycosyltransferase family 2 protein n=1 Tax=Bradyrhizobium sp. TaxID=376 RepID=UPI001EBC52EF|nr:glycosyltransferase family 2 protein [Bradyrhizobium sp.]MBV9570815.1 glycosyltransferase family 2 protein [Alphaproteobacteria bacterium]MBV9979066.1 glycosyltransferase family 2 protein [Bradyrhizobium sp.]
MPDVTIAIPSYRRPSGLEFLLLAIDGLQTTASVSVLVADNDAQGREALAVCKRLHARGYRWPLECIVAPERGIAQARNALIEHILANSPAEFIAMLDDDEWPTPDWLEAFLKVQASTKAEALHGAVLRAFESTPEDSAAACHGIAPMRGKTGPISAIYSTSNVLIRRVCLEELPAPAFDPNFALSGGEDRDCFERLRRQGRRFAWADEAIVYASVPASRASFGWALQRAYRTGNSDMRVILKHCRGAAEMLPEILKIGGVALLYPFVLLASVPFAHMHAQALCKIWRAAGKTAALLGHRYDEYAVIHGA